MIPDTVLVVPSGLARVNLTSFTASVPASSVEMVALTCPPDEDSCAGVQNNFALPPTRELRNRQSRRWGTVYSSAGGANNILLWNGGRVGVDFELSGPTP